MHCDATSEKNAMGWFLDGRVSAVLGTHTHVQTADARVLAGGTAFITDVGMCGPWDSVIGVKKELVLERFLSQRPVQFEPAKRDVWLQGAHRGHRRRDRQGPLHRAGPGEGRGAVTMAPATRGSAARPPTSSSAR